MGLSAPRRRAKLANDPNNSHWTQSSTKYGQRILESQGWKTGDSIGRLQNAATNPQSVFSHLSLKEGNLGLGAKNIRGVDEEPTGLADFQDLLGRLNGKSEVSIQRTQQVRGEIARHRYLERRGTISFVKGGYMERDEPNAIEPARQKKSDATENTELQAETPAILEDDTEAKGKLQEDQSKADVEAKAARKQRKEERRKHRKLKKVVMDGQTVTPTSEIADKAVAKSSNTTNKPTQSTNNRNFVRQRYIRQKRLAMSDAKALNEIFMVKS